MNYLDRLFFEIEQRYAEAIDWTTLNQLATPLSASGSAPLPEEDPAARRLAAHRAA
jgi:hypothetical protein